MQKPPWVHYDPTPGENRKRERKMDNREKNKVTKDKNAQKLSLTHKAEAMLQEKQTAARENTKEG